MSDDYYNLVRRLSGLSIDVIGRECQECRECQDHPNIATDLLRLMFEAKGFNDKLKANICLKDYAYFYRLFRMESLDEAEERLYDVIAGNEADIHLVIDGMREMTSDTEQLKIDIDKIYRDREEFIISINLIRSFVIRYIREAIENEINAWLADKPIQLWFWIEDKNSGYIPARTLSGALILSTYLSLYIEEIIILERRVSDYREDFVLQIEDGWLRSVKPFPIDDWLRHII